MPVPYCSMLHTHPTIYHFLAAKEEPYQKAYLFTKTIEEFSGEKKTVRKLGQQAEKRQDRKIYGSRQKIKKRGIRMKSNDSPEIPDQGKHETSPTGGG